MKGIILHGGNGTRLRPLTYTDVKQLLPIAGKPISEYALENLIEVGIKEINIVIGSVGGEEVKKYYGDGKRWNVDITYTYQDSPLGIAQAIGLTKEFVNNDQFIVFLGDNFLQDGISKLYQDFISKNYEGMLALVQVKNPSQFGIAEIRDDEIIKLVEKPKNPNSDLAIAGVYFLNADIFEIISNLKPSGRGEYEITEAYQAMVDNGKKIGYSIINGWFKDTGTVEDFLDCNRLVLDRIEGVNLKDFHEKQISGRVKISKDTIISENSRILGPCYIGSGTKIEDSYIGPFTSIGSNCIVKNVEIEDSIVMDGTVIEMSNGTRITGSLIGANTSIMPTNSRSKSIKLVLGRDSKLEI
ncbi:MAG: glucose-1-phosphate thymidylyltransferase [Thermoplasmataceae archaeon]